MLEDCFIEEMPQEFARGGQRFEGGGQECLPGRMEAKPRIRVEKRPRILTVQIRIMCPKRGAVSQQTRYHFTSVTTGRPFPGYSPSPLSAPRPLAAPHQSILHSLPSQEAVLEYSHPGSLQVVEERHWREAAGQEEGEVGVSSLKWQVHVASWP